MDDDIQALKKLKWRRQDATEQLVANSSLRDNLPDEQAQQLLDWGLRQVNEAAVQTVSLPDAEADALMAATITAVRRVMRQVNRLVPDLAEMDEADARARLEEFVAHLRLATGQSPAPLQEEQLIRRRQQHDRQETFHRLMQLLIPAQEEE